MFLGTITFILAICIAIFLLYRVAEDTRNTDGLSNAEKEPSSSKFVWFSQTENLLKSIIVLTLCAALFATKLWPLALMILVAAGCITAVEFWKQHMVSELKLTNQKASTKQETSSQITVREAREVLGLDKNASASEIRSAHKNLIAQLHPDRGGTDYLAAKINESRTVLLTELESPSSE